MGSHLNRVVTVRMPDVGFAASPRTQYIDERDRREAVETESRSMSVRPVVLAANTLI
jgi:pantothenate synthetase